MYCLTKTIKEMKALTLTATLFVFCVAGAHAQAAEKQIKQFPPIEKKKLDLNYLGKDSSSVLKRIKENNVASRYLKKYEDVNVDQEAMEKLEFNMPIMQPDSSVRFHILAMEPDSTTLYHIQVKKPEL